MSTKTRLDKLEALCAQHNGSQLLPLSANVAIQDESLFRVTQGGSDEAASMMTHEQVAELSGPTIVIRRSELGQS